MTSSIRYTHIEEFVNEKKLAELLHDLPRQGGAILLYISAQNAGMIVSRVSDLGSDSAVRFEALELSPRNRADSVANQEQKWNIFFADPVFEILVVADIQLAGEEVQLDDQARVDHRRRNLTGKGVEVQTVQRTKAAVAARCVQVQSDCV
ncbi:hypothetical protein B0A55_13570 [Friedmanniomyces simplex]|uniref:DUF6606 domain-containing protein n=1 Tax=Friedmanniomyces simplex TaxID=329884 RepID=A0A4U0VF77_9PEZI|nr:hypothetical protein B0A55_13570 [Friedmanniomyces simplex]